MALIQGAVSGLQQGQTTGTENGRFRLDADDLENILDLYGVLSPERDVLPQQCRESRHRGWWIRHKDVSTGSNVAG